jgi:hypothetical protein
VDNLFAPLYIYSLAGAASHHLPEMESVRPVVGMYLLAQALMTFDDKMLVDTLVATILMADPSLAREVSSGDGADEKDETSSRSLSGPGDASAAQQGESTSSCSVDADTVAVYGEAFYLAVVDLMGCKESDFSALPAVCMLQAMVENAGVYDGLNGKGSVSFVSVPFLTLPVLVFKTPTAVSARVLQHRQLLLPHASTPIGSYNTDLVNRLIELVETAVSVDSKVGTRKRHVRSL